MTEGPRKILPFILSLWLCCLIAGYTVLHMFYTLTQQPASPLLSFLPALIYALGGLLLGYWGNGRRRSGTNLPMRQAGTYLLFALSLLLFLLGLIFSINGLRQFYLLR